MFRVARKMVCNSDDAADIVQEVFIYLFDKLKGGNIITHLNTWLYRATINKSIDKIRKQQKFQNIESLNDTKTEDGLIENIEKQEVTAAINCAISKLGTKERVLIVLYSEGLTYKEISDATGVKFSSVGKTLSRILGKLEEELKKEHNELY